MEKVQEHISTNIQIKQLETYSAHSSKYKVKSPTSNGKREWENLKIISYLLGIIEILYTSFFVFMNLLSYRLG
jgi:hypothetical protein